MKDQPRLAAALERATSALLAEMNADGHWTGEPSSSALSTATAVVALANVDATRHATLIRGGLRWLAGNVNADGGWGDTTRSKSNISTTALCWAAFAAAKADGDFPSIVQNAETWLRKECGADNPSARHARTKSALPQSTGAETAWRSALLPDAPRRPESASVMRIGTENVRSFP